MADHRYLDDWLKSYLEFTATHEAPESYHLWSGLTIISAATRRRVFIELEHGIVYPNLYVIIVAESAKTRKSVAMDMARDLLIDAIPDMKIMRDSMTSQGLIHALNHKVTVIKDNKIDEELRSDVAIFADEVANLFSYERNRASQMVIFLTRTYGCPPIYDHTTVRDSTIRLFNLYPVLLGGTDPRNLKVLPEDAIGGLTGRLIWVIESQRRHNRSGWKRDPTALLQRKLSREYLIHDLQRIAQLQGELTVTQEAMDLFDKWYGELSKKDVKDPETDAFYHRCHTTAQRIAILLALANNDAMVLDAKHMAGGIALVEQQLPEMKRIMLWSGVSLYEQHRAKLIGYLKNSPGMVATWEGALHYMGVTIEDFIKIVETLKLDGSVTIPPIKIKGKQILKLEVSSETK